MLTIVIHPEYGHPSSIWPSQELVNSDAGPYVLPSQVGMDETLGNEVLAWTSKFQEFFVTELDDFSARPQWRPGLNRFEWYDEGYRIVHQMRLAFPNVYIKPEFAQYVFSVNERRESMGLPPIHLPQEPKIGHISVTEAMTYTPKGQS